MKKKEAKRIKKLVTRYFIEWYGLFGFGPFHREVRFHNSADEFRLKNGRMVAMRINSSWYYKDLYVDVCLPALEGMSKERIEGIVVHELGHVLVNPMSSKRKKREELVVTDLTNVLIWVRNDARRISGAGKEGK